MSGTYCPDCKKVTLYSKHMPKVHLELMPGKTRENRIIYDGILIRYCKKHVDEKKGKLVTIEGLDEDTKCFVAGVDSAGEIIIQKFKNVRDLVLGGFTKGPVEFLESIKTSFFAKSELEALGW
jgi:hypothetical protein